MRIFISAAEPSADLHASRLIAAARRRWPLVQFYGLAGPRMQAAGATPLADLTGQAAMLSGIVRLLGPAWRAMTLVEQSWRENPPDLAIFLDSGTLHLPLAKKARRLGLKTLYYIAPQTWASRAYRNRGLRRDLDAVACILPFEEQYFRGVGVRARFVGHPLFESLDERRPRADIERHREWDDKAPTIALLPGSRAGLIGRMLQLQLDVLAAMQMKLGRRVNVLVSQAKPHEGPGIPKIDGILHYRGRPATVLVDDNATLLRHADLVLVASGTATLEVAAAGKPMIVMYDAGGLLRLPHALFGRWVVKLPHLSLVNILAGRRIVPEYMPFVTDVDCIARTACNLLDDAGWRGQMVRDMAAVVGPLRVSRASQNVCDLMAELTGA